MNDSVAFRPDNPLVADVRVRQALLHATNAQEIVDDPVLGQLSAGDLGHLVDRRRLRRPLGQADIRPGAGQAAARRGGLDAGRRTACARRTASRWRSPSHESLPQPQNKAVLQLLGQQWAKVGVKLDVLAGLRRQPRSSTTSTRMKTPVVVAEVGRADPDVIKSQFHSANRDALLQKGGLSSKVQELHRPQAERACSRRSPPRPTRRKRLEHAGEAQAYLLDQAYDIPIFEEPQVFAGAPYVQGDRRSRRSGGRASTTSGSASTDRCAGRWRSRSADPCRAI